MAYAQPCTDPPGEPPSPSSLRRSIVFLVGRNSHGKWVVQDQRGYCGGLFVHRKEALKFALENGNRLQAIIIVPGTLELDLRPHEIEDLDTSAINRDVGLGRVGMHG
jgi:hypothetical protein